MSKPFDVVDSLNLLGIQIGKVQDENVRYKWNFEENLNRCQHICNSWENRNLSLKGKVVVINSLIISTILYPASITSTPINVFRDFKKMVCKFLWNSTVNRVAYNTICKKVCDGGLGLLDLETMVKSAHISWVKRLCSDESIVWTVYPKLIFGVESLYTLFVTKNKNRCKKVSHPFYKVLWQTWNGFYNKEPANEEEVLNEALWHNERICINKQPFVWKKWKEAGILKITDLFSDHNQFMSTQEILAIYGVQASFLDVLQLRAAIPWLRGLVVSDHRPSTYDLLIGYKTKTINLYTLTSKNIYGVLLDNLTHISKAKDKWCQQFPEEQFDGQKWSICYTMAFKASRETKIQSLQFKILHRICPAESTYSRGRV